MGGEAARAIADGASRRAPALIDRACAAEHCAAADARAFQDRASAQTLTGEVQVEGRAGLQGEQREEQQVLPHRRAAAEAAGRPAAAGEGARRLPAEAEAAVAAVAAVAAAAARRLACPEPACPVRRGRGKSPAAPRPSSTGRRR